MLVNPKTRSIKFITIQSPMNKEQANDQINDLRKKIDGVRKK